MGKPKHTGQYPVQWLDYSVFVPKVASGYKSRADPGKMSFCQLLWRPPNHAKNFPKTHLGKESMNIKLMSLMKNLFLAGFLMTSMVACSPFTKIQGDDKKEIKLNGSWTAIYSGAEKLEGVAPKPTIIFNTGNNSISGFDGCNNFQENYAFADGKLRAEVTSARMAWSSDVARGVSEQMANLFSNGAEVIEVSIYGQHVIMLKNSSAD
jgi:hypothetical protein